MKAAFIGFRHGHIVGLYNRLKEDPRCEIVAACEEDAEAAEAARKNWGIDITHTDFSAMLRQTEFDILAIGDYFGIRGSRAIAGLKAGKHIIADKPLCTSLDELAQIRALSAEKGLAVGLMLDFRNHGNVAAAKEIIDAGRLGEIHAIQFGGQHPLSWGTRAAWYFEDGKQGGTINDIAIHGLDAVEYLTTRPVTELTAARTWNAFADKAPKFMDAAQLMFALDNRCGVIGDVSYFAPEQCGFPNPFYWRFTVWGRKGVMEFNYFDDGVKLCLSGAKTPEFVKPSEGKSDYLAIFVNEIAGKKESFGREHILSVTEKTLRLQKMADDANA